MGVQRSLAQVFRTCAAVLPCLLLAVTSLAAQQPAASGEPRFLHEVWTIEDGLPVNHVNSLIQTRDGYLWFTTFDGLVRFDGVRFRVFDTGNSQGLPTNRLLTLQEADDGVLWFLTERGRAVRFDGERFHTIETEDDIARDLVKTGDGGMWILTRREIGLFQDGDYRQLTRFAEELDTRALRPSVRGGFWVTTWAGRVGHFSGGEMSWYGTPHGLNTGQIHDVHETEEGGLWVAGDAGVFVQMPGGFERFAAPGRGPWSERTWSLTLNPKSGALLLRSDSILWSYHENELEPILWAPSGETTPKAVLWADDGALWVAQSRTLFRNARPVLETSDRIVGLIQDREGSIWLASEGLHRLKPATVSVLGEPEGMIRNVYSAAQDSSDALWFGSLRHGLARWADGETTIFTRDSGLSSNLPFSVNVDRAGRTWVGYWRGGACLFQDGSCRAPEGAPPEFATANVRAIFQDGRGDHWFGADEGLFRRSRKGWRTYTAADGLPVDGVRVIKEAPDGGLWIGTYGGGVARLGLGGGGSVEVLDTGQGLSSDLIRSLYQDDEGVLWVGTEGRGLNRIALPPGAPLSSADVTAYTESDGLFSNVVHQILPDDHGRLWMSSNEGIFWAARSDLEAFAAGSVERIRVVSYTERDGLRNREGNGGVQSPGVRARDGRLWFAMSDGVAFIDPDDINRNDVPPPVVIETVDAGGEVFNASARGGLSLPLGARSLEINYTGLSLLAPEKVRFRYRLEGFDEDWIFAGGRRTAFYTNVPAGSYVFRVTASNNEGVWNEEGSAVAVTVPRYFYETPWFIGLMLLAGGGLVVLGVRWREGAARAREAELKAVVAARTEEVVRERDIAEEARREAEEQRIKAERHSEIAEDALRTVAAQAERLEELDQAKSRFFANITHEFRTPLTLTIGPLKDLRAGLHGELGGGVTESIDLALRNSLRLLRLVNQILDVAKLESGEMKLDPSPGSLDQLLQGVVQAFTGLAERRGIDLRYAVPGDPVVCAFDWDLMEKVFLNLLSNAVKFTPEEGAIRVELATAGERARVTVRDSGPGIAESDLPLVFERFYRANRSGSQAEPGTGIGLSLAKELVELHGGTIEVVSEPGFGSTFTVSLPVAVEGATAVVEKVGSGAIRPAAVEVQSPEMAEAPSPAVATAEEEKDKEKEEAEDRTTVLVIDDNAELRGYLRKHLEASYRVLEAGDGASGLALARDALPDLVVCDVMMPDMDGLSVCRSIKADPELASVPVVLLTARASQESRIEGLEEGSDDYLTKPFDPKELKVRVENLLASRRRLRELARSQALLTPSEVEVESSGDRFLDRVRRVIEERMADEDFDVEALAEEIGHSRSSLYRRLRELHSESPAETIKRMRLERAAQLLAGGAGSVSEIAYGVGFKSVSHFSRAFKERFGRTPSSYEGGGESGGESEASEIRARVVSE